MVVVTDCHIMRRRGDGPMVDADGDVDLRGYFIAPIELFTPAELTLFIERARGSYSQSIDAAALRASRAEDDERQRLRDLGVAFVES